MAGGVFDMAVGSLTNLTAAFFTPEVNDIVNNVAKDSGVADSTSDDMTMPGDSTQDGDFLSAENLFETVDMFIPEENQAISNFWGAFKSGLSNSGDKRKGSRDSK